MSANVIDSGAGGGLRGEEVALLLLLVVMVLAVFGSAVLHRDKAAVWKPTVMYALLYVYYFIIGPVVAVFFGETRVGVVDFRPYFQSAWLAGVVSFISFNIGYICGSGTSFNRIMRVDRGRFDKVYWPFLIGLGVLVGVGVLFVVSQVGFGIVQSGKDERLGAVVGGVASGYLYMLIDLGVLLGVMVLGRWVEKRRVGFLVFYVVLVVVMFSVYIKIGFRGRVVVFVLASYICFYLLKRKRPGVVSVGLIGLGVLFL
ncbi:MAG: hypothetical protein CUN56_14170, partial [Phototrophicales bacterium]